MPGHHATGPAPENSPVISHGVAGIDLLAGHHQICILDWLGWPAIKVNVDRPAFKVLNRPRAGRRRLKPGSKDLAGAALSTSPTLVIAPIAPEVMRGGLQGSASPSGVPLFTGMAVFGRS